MTDSTTAFTRADALGLIKKVVADELRRHSPNAPAEKAAELLAWASDAEQVTFVTHAYERSLERGRRNGAEDERNRGCSLSDAEYVASRAIVSMIHALSLDEFDLKENRPTVAITVDGERIEADTNGLLVQKVLDVLHRRAGCVRSYAFFALDGGQDLADQLFRLGVSLLREHYYADVRDCAEAIVDAVVIGEVTDEDGLLEYIEQTVDGTQRVTYTHLARAGLMASDNEDAYEDAFGERTSDASAAMASAMTADVRDTPQYKSAQAYLDDPDGWWGDELDGQSFLPDGMSGDQAAELRDDPSVRELLKLCRDTHGCLSWEASDADALRAAYGRLAQNEKDEEDGCEEDEAG